MRMVLGQWRRRLAAVGAHGYATARAEASAATASLPWDGIFKSAITPGVCAGLQKQGYAVVDGVLGPSICAALRCELAALKAAGLMALNCTHLVRGNTTELLQKAAVWEAELSLDPTVRAAAPLFAQVDADRTLGTMLSVMLPQLRLDSHAIKLQINEGNGGCFPLHFDSDELLDQRRITALFYLNQNWQSSWGGQLRLCPFPHPPVDIEPIADRLVLFSSTRMLHRVLPCTHERHCFTIWLSQSRNRRVLRHPPSLRELLPPSNASADQVLAFLLHPAVRQHVCKLVYADEWASSIEESHPPSDARTAALQVHYAEVDKIRRALSRYDSQIQALTAGGASGAAYGKHLLWL